MRRIANRKSVLITLVLVLGLIGVACTKSSFCVLGRRRTTLQQGAGGALVFAPTELTVAKGIAIHREQRRDSAPHTFTVTGQSTDEENQPGQSQQVTIDLPPGTYPFICRFHVSQGMKGTLVVQG